MDDVKIEIDQAAVAAAVDCWVDMERKARAWDKLHAVTAAAESREARELLAFMDGLVHPAHSSSS